jgi:multicopper oxidase
LKHTVNVAPGETVKFEFTADNPGRWFFHCHNLYHLEAGMARVFEYDV